MPTQYDYLVDEDLRRQLRQKEKAAEIKLAQCFNRGRKKEQQLRIPNLVANYDQSDPQLLALLWCLAGNQDALIELAKQVKKALALVSSLAGNLDALSQLAK